MLLLPEIARFLVFEIVQNHSEPFTRSVYDFVPLIQTGVFIRIFLIDRAVFRMV